MRNKIIITLVVAIAIGGTVWYQHKIRIQRKTSEAAISTADEIKQPGINGIPVAESVAKQRPLTVVVENHPDSRPQSGLSDADFVYETLTEGGITRYLAVYQTRSADAIGPIRSARPTFTFLANQWAGLFTHVGGSEQALKEIRTGVYRNLSDLDEFYNGAYFHRATDRMAPHNTYSSTTTLREFVKEKDLEKWTPGTFWNFKAIPTDQLTTEITNIAIPFSTPSYTAGYTFDASTNTYTRTTGGKPAIDRNNQLPISPKNVLIQFSNATAIPVNDTTSINMQLDQNGSLLLFTGGKLTEGRWKFENGETIYTDKENKPLVLQPGQTWIELVPNSLKSAVTWK